MPSNKFPHHICHLHDARHQGSTPSFILILIGRCCLEAHVCGPISFLFPPSLRHHSAWRSLTNIFDDGPSKNLRNHHQFRAANSYASRLYKSTPPHTNSPDASSVSAPPRAMLTRMISTRALFV